MNVIAIIPARYGSTRLPGKLILPEAKAHTGKHIIEHVYCGASKARLVKKVIVATDDRRIYDVVKQFGGEVEMTPAAIPSGTDRIAWVVENVSSIKGLNPDMIVNVQGDEPDVCGEMIDEAISILRKDTGAAVMSTLANIIESAVDVADPHVVKVVSDNNGDALYFSRSPIPHVRGARDGIADLDKHPFLRHIGLYVYRTDFLLKFPTLPSSRLEMLEGLEQLRVLSNGYRIKVAVTRHKSCGIDTMEDLERFLSKYRKQIICRGEPVCSPTLGQTHRSAPTIIEGEITKCLSQ